MPLVGPVAAIVHPVALHSLRDASIVSAQREQRWNEQKKEKQFGLLEERVSTSRYLLARELVLVTPSLAAVRLVGSVETVWQTVAEAGPQYALAVAARELVLRGAGWRHMSKETLLRTFYPIYVDVCNEGSLARDFSIFPFFHFFFFFFFKRVKAHRSNDEKKIWKTVKSGIAERGMGIVRAMREEACAVHSAAIIYQRACNRMQRIEWTRVFVLTPTEIKTYVKEQRKNKQKVEKDLDPWRRREDEEKGEGNRWK